ncbi:unnamed protein product [Chrysoparadoxa australica]
MIQLNEQHLHEAGLHDLMPDLTPMLDILFILLVFFMLTAGAVAQSIDIALPSSLEEELTLVNEPKHIMLEIHTDRFVVDGEQIFTLAALKQHMPNVIAQKTDYALVVAGDKNIPIERLLKVLTFLQSQGIATANILMQEET